MAQAVRDQKGWKWVQASDLAPRSDMCRVYPRPTTRTDGELAQAAALADEYDGLIETWQDVEDPPAQVAARFETIDSALAAFATARPMTQTTWRVAGSSSCSALTGTRSIRHDPGDVPLGTHERLLCVTDRTPSKR